MNTPSPTESSDRYQLDPQAEIYLLNFDTINGTEFLDRMRTNRCGSLNPDPGSQWKDINRVSIGDGFLFWLNDQGITTLGVAENTPVFTQPPGHRCGYWDIPMGKSWRDLDPVITFAEFDQMMLNRIDCGVMGWTLFRLTRFGRAEAYQVYQTAISRIK